MRKLHPNQFWISSCKSGPSVYIKDVGTMYQIKGISNVSPTDTRLWVRYQKGSREEIGHYEKIAGFISNNGLVKSPFNVGDLVNWRGQIMSVIRILHNSWCPFYIAQSETSRGFWAEPYELSLLYTS